MPLLQCPDCGHDVSSEAANCPHCGRPPLAPPAVASPKPADSSAALGLGLIGSAVLFLGAFAPIVSIPIAGAQNYFQNGKGDGVVIVVLAVISVFLTFGKKFRGLWFTGLAALVVLAVTFVSFESRVADARQQMKTELAGNPFAGLGEMAINSVQLQWGWAVLVVGALLICAAAMKGSVPRK